MTPAGISSFDFLDFGCSKGANIKFTEGIMPGAKGLGIDIDQHKIDFARSQGHQAINFDILQLADEPVADFVTMSHFLEHIPGVPSVHAFIEKGAAVARDFVHIRQPFFDTDGYLMTLGLKLYWSDWIGHRNAMTAFDAYKMCRSLQSKGLIRSFAILGRGPIQSSAHEAVIQLSAPIDSQKYTSDHGKKPTCQFDFPVFSELVLDIVKRDSPRRDALLQKLHHKMPMETLFASAGHPGWGQG